MMASSALREPHWCQDSLILLMRYISELSRLTLIEEVVKISFNANAFNFLFNARQRNNLSKTGTHLEHLFRKLCFTLHLTPKTRLLILLSGFYICFLVNQLREFGGRSRLHFQLILSILINCLLDMDIMGRIYMYITSRSSRVETCPVATQTIDK